VGFRGWVGLDLHSSDAPQIVWYYSNVPSNASGVLQVDTVGSIVRQLRSRTAAPIRQLRDVERALL
jgi:hypothetical protein